MDSFEKSFKILSRSYRENFQTHDQMLETILAIPLRNWIEEEHYLNPIIA